MAGYTRQSLPDIQNGSEITAPPLNAEFDQLLSAFGVSGHTHDGLAGNAPKINLTTSLSGYLPQVHGGVDGKNNTSATSSPTVADDGTQGYAVGSIWINNTTKRIFVCSANTTGAANWHELVANTGTSLAPNVHNTVDIGTNAVRYKDFYLAGNADIDGTLNVLGNTSLTTAETTGLATLATADINGGTIDGSVIGGTTAQAITGTTITANTGFTGALTGNVTGNVTGNLTGNVTGDVTGDLTGNVTASSGTTTLNNLVVDGTVDFTSTALLNVSDPTSAQHAATKIYTDTADALKLDKAGGTMSGDITMGGNTVTGLGTPSADSDAATKGFVDSSIANVIDAAPAALDTLNELAAALGDDASFSTTVTNSIATKLPLAGGTMTGDITMGANAVTSTAAPTTDDELTRKGYVDTQDALKLNLSGGTMSGAIAMGTSKITGLGDPTAAQDAVSKSYSDTQDATKLNLSGGTMTGNIVLGANKATSTATPTAADDLTRKAYVDGILGSATSSASSSAAAAISATNAATSATNAATSETNAGNSAAAAAASYDNFDDRYLGAKSSAPTVDNDGDALVTGALYWDTTSNELYVWSGSAWAQGAFTAGSLLSNVVEDTTPQLGGDLDLNGSNITGTGNLDITGTLTSDGLHINNSGFTVEGSSADDFETTVTFTNPTADRTITIPDADGQVVIQDTSLGKATISGTAPGVIFEETDSAIEDSQLYRLSDDMYLISDPSNVKGDTKFVIGVSGSYSAFHPEGLYIGSFTTAPSCGLEVATTDAIHIPRGTTAQRPTGENGMLRYNSTDAAFEGYADGAWGAIGGGGDQQTATTTSTTQTAIATYTASSSLGIEITVIATDTVATERTISKLLITHDGTTAVATEYGTVNTATAVATFDVDISGSNVRLLATAASSNSTNFTANAVILA